METGLERKKKIVLQDDSVIPLYGQLVITTSQHRLELDAMYERIFASLYTPAVVGFEETFMVVDYLRMFGIVTPHEIDEAQADLMRQYHPIGKEKFLIHKLEPLTKPGGSYILPDVWNFGFEIEVSDEMERDIIDQFHKGDGLLSEHVLSRMSEYCLRYGLHARLKRDRKDDCYNFACLWMRIHGMGYELFTSKERNQLDFLRKRIGGDGDPEYRKKQKRKDFICWIKALVFVSICGVAIYEWVSFIVKIDDMSLFILASLAPIYVIVGIFYWGCRRC